MRSWTASMILVSVICLLSGATAQEAPSALLGEITDPSGAVLRGVTVTITDTASGSRRVVQTGADGNYVAENEKPGTYDITARKQGFKETTITGVSLQVAQRGRVDMTLQVGSVSEQVQVEGEAPAIETDTASVGKVINTRDIVNLPLNGREFLQLATLIPGVEKTYKSNQENTGGSVSEDGMSDSSNNTMIDGIMNQETGAARMTFSPSVDMIQEFKMQVNSYDAEYGRTPGAQIEVVTKRGGDSYHGSAYEFLRNNAMDARPFFQTTALPPFRRNQFGGTFGGHIPHDKKDFFFISYDGLRSSEGLTDVLTLFQPAYRPGFNGSPDANFTGSGTTIYDPQTGQPFPNDTIPASRINPVTLYFMNKFIPTAGVSNAGSNNYISNPTKTYDNNQFSARYDRDLTSKDSLFLRYTRNTIVGLLPMGDSGVALPLPGLGEDINLYGENHEIHENHLFGPTTMNTVVLGFSQYNQQRHPQTTNQNLIPQSGLQGVPDDQAGIPDFSIAGYSPLTDNFVSPISQPFDNYVFEDTFSKVVGKHSIRVGFDFLYSRTQSYLDLFDRGTLSFGPYYTTAAGNSLSGNEYNAYADFLLGLPVSSSIWLKPVITDWRSHTESGFIQDDWHATKNLTLNLGLRYDLYTPTYDKLNRMTALALPQGINVYPGSVPTLPGTPAGSVTASSLGYPRNLDFPTTHNNWGPRFGFAWKLPHSDKTVLRGGSAVFYNWLVIDSATDLSLGPPWVPNTSVSCAQTAPCLNATNPFSTNVLAVPASNVANKTNRTPYNIQYSLGIQHEFTPGLSLEMNYVGNAGFKNYIPLNINEAVPGPGTIVSREPYPRFGNLTEILSIGVSHYDSLQVALRKNYDRTGLVLLASYSYSHALGDSVSGPQFEENGADSTAGVRWYGCVICEYGNTPYDIRHIFSLSANYELPIGRGKPLAGGANGVLNGIVGGWSVQSIVSLHSGNYITPADSVNVSNSGNTRPDVLCNPNGFSHSSKPAEIGEWFNTACFAQPALYTFGNSGVGIIETPGYADVDLAFHKRFPIGERLGLQVRGEFFNAFNHTNLGAPNASSFGTPVFGTINGIVGNARETQLGLRFDF